MEDQLRDVQQRLDRAEQELSAIHRRSRRLRWMTATLLLGAIAFFGVQPAALQRQAEASFAGGFGHRLRGPVTVVDPLGRPILQIGAGPTGRGMLVYDDSGNAVCGIGTTAEGRGLTVFDARERLIA